MAKSSNEVGGYDCNFVDVPPKSLECCVCMLALRDPHVLSCCGVKVCQSCVDQLQTSERPCPKCKQSFVTMLEKELQRTVLNLLVYCSRKKKGCEWKGELRNLETHSQRECGYVEVECPYKCGGSFQRRLLQNHEIEECPECPSNERRESMARKIDKIAAEFEDKVVAIVEELHKQKAAVQDEMAELRKAFSGLASRLESQEVDDFSRNGPSWELVSPQGSLSSPYMPCKIIMPYFSSHKIAASPWYSLPFYTFEGGYKMALLVRASDKVGGTYVSVYLSLMKGQNDNQLEWPFEGVITIGILNWVSNAKHILRTLNYKYVPLENKKKVVVGERGRERGFTNILPHTCLDYNADEGTQYVRNDTMCFGVFS